MIYLTYNDQPSGVYFSQVTDVCAFVNKRFNCNIRLLALISIRGFLENRKSIKQNFPEAIVLPMFPKQKNWRRNKLLLKILFLFIGKQSVWCRGIFATNLALLLKKNNWTNRVVFDGRGAYDAEYNEYLNKITSLSDSISDLERDAILLSDFRCAVSEKLVTYWHQKYNYVSKNHCVIPCTINSNESHYPSENEIKSVRKELGFANDDVVIVYSGSAADWQSLQMVDDFLLLQMRSNTGIKFILLSNSPLEQLKMYKEFPNRIIQKWVKAHEVKKYLYASDYGMLIRENSVTNEVASPTKFAEYLHAGLKVLISENIGDFSAFTKKNNCGTIITDFEFGYNFTPLTYSQKAINFKLAQNHFTKNVFEQNYNTIVQLLKEK